LVAIDFLSGRCLACLYYLPKIGERLHESAERGIRLRDVPVMLRLVGLVLHQIGIVGLKFRIGFDRQVWLVKPDGQEKRLVLVTFLFQPSDRLVHDDVGRESLDFTHRLAITDEVGGVLVAWRGVVLSGQPPVVAVIIGLGVLGVVEALSPFLRGES